MSDIYSTSHVNETMNKGVADPVPLASEDELQKAIPNRDSLRYIKNDTYIADVSTVLGRVYYEKIGSDTLNPFIFNVAVTVDPASKLTAPQTVSELIVDSKLSAKVEALSLLSANINAEELLEVRIINNSSARVVDRGDVWDAAIMKWLSNPVCQELINDPAIGTISVVTGAIQKYFTTKKYKKFEAGSKGSGWGVNAEGSLFTSTSQFDLSVVYGLDLVTFKQAKSVNEFVENLASQNVVNDKVELAEVNHKFDRMVMMRSSIFRLTDGPNV